MFVLFPVLFLNGLDLDLRFFINGFLWAYESVFITTTSALFVLILQTVEEIYKVASISLSPNVPAQIFVSLVMTHHVFNARILETSRFFPNYVTIWQMGLMVNPPKPGDISYDQYIRERYD